MSQGAGALKAASTAMKYLTFKLAGERYGIEILKVQELRSYEVPTGLASAPHFVKGVINLRGMVVPIIDLRIRFKLDPRSYDEFTVVVVVNVAGLTVGLVVDAVSDVLAIPSDAVRAIPQFAPTPFDARFITGLGLVGEEIVVLLDIEDLVASSDVGVAATAPAA